MRLVNSEGELLKGERERKIHLVPGEDKRIDWLLDINTHRHLKLKVEALTDEESDAMELTIPVIPYGLQVTKANGGLHQGATQISFQMPKEVKRASSRLEISVAPSMSASLFESLEYLTEFPHGCVEQTMSRFMPNIIVNQTMKDLGIKNPKLEKNLAKYTSAGLQKLYGYQHSDGGWGWWKKDSSNPYMSAYVLLGLSNAKKAGYDVSQNAINRGLKFIASHIPKEKNLDNQAYMIYAYSQVKNPQRKWLDDLYKKREKLNDFATALLTLTYHKSGETDNVHLLVKQLEERVHLTGLSANWGGANHYRHWASNKIQSTAYVMKAILAVNPKHELIGKTVNYLSKERKGSYWHSTKDTASAIFALTDFMRKTNELNANYKAEVLINGKVLRTINVKGNALQMKAVKLNLEGEEIPVNAKIEVRKKGEGNLYYSCTMDYFSTGQELEKGTANGLKVTRKYYRLVPKETKDSITYKRVPLVGEVKSGEEIEVHLSVESKSGEYMMLEDYLPAGCEIVEDKSDLNNRYRYWWNYCSNREARDEKMVFFNGSINGKQNYIYTIRAETPGEFKVMPAKAELMYQREVNGSSGMTELTIVD